MITYDCSPMPAADPAIFVLSLGVRFLNANGIIIWISSISAKLYQKRSSSLWTDPSSMWTQNACDNIKNSWTTKLCITLRLSETKCCGPLWFLPACRINSAICLQFLLYSLGIYFGTSVLLDLFTLVSSLALSCSHFFMDSWKHGGIHAKLNLIFSSCILQFWSIQLVSSFQILWQQSLKQPCSNFFPKLWQQQGSII